MDLFCQFLSLLYIVSHQVKTINPLTDNALLKLRKSCENLRSSGHYYTVPPQEEHIIMLTG